MINEITHFIQDQLNNNDFFKGAGLAAFLSFITYSSKSYISWLYTRIKRKVTYHFVIENTSDLYELFTNYLSNNHHNKFRSIKHKISYSNETKQQDLITEQYSESYLIWIKGYPYIVSKQREKMEGAMELWNAYRDFFYIRGLFAKPYLNLLDTLLTRFKNKSKENFEANLLSPSAIGWDVTSVIPYRSMDTIFFNKELKKDLLLDIDKFLSSEEWYNTRGIPYKRGYLLTGPPGNGKSSFIRALAYYTKRNILNLNLNAIKNDSELEMVASRIMPNSLLILEDIDSVVEGRNTSGDISFSSILNMLDGVTSVNNLIVVMTTNLFDYLDPALIRPGRIDKIVNVSNPTIDEAEFYIRKFYDDDTLTLENISKEYSYSELQGLCMNYNKDQILNKI